LYFGQGLSQKLFFCIPLCFCLNLLHPPSQFPHLYECNTVIQMNND
jgi:hypothetical protein